MSNWLIYTGSSASHDGISRLPEPPPWRSFSGEEPLPLPAGGSGNEHGAVSYRPSPRAVEQVNAALYLRRPLLVTGPPGAGKSMLAYSIARELRLGPVLHWPITSTSSLQDGLYRYDALTRLYDASRVAGTGSGNGTGNGAAPREAPGADTAEDIGRFLRLGPLGTALLPYDRPRVLLIDEIDKSDIDLPNDLLHVFEKGEYQILELARLENPVAEVMTEDSTTDRVPVDGRLVRTRQFPLVVMTSNGEREFPPAFLRRCIQLRLSQPETEEELARIVEAHLGDLAARSTDLLRRFLERRDAESLATDQLLNAVYLLHHASGVTGDDRLALADRVMSRLAEHRFSDDELLDGRSDEAPDDG